MASRASTSAGKRRAAARAAHRAAASRRRNRPKARIRAPHKRRNDARRPAKRPAKPRKRTRRGLPGRACRRPSRRAGLVLALVVVAIAAGYQLWLRHSSLVAVRDVNVTGLSSPGSDEIEAALSEAAREMTTLSVDEAELEAATARFPTVASVSADADFPRGLAVEVTERLPAALIEAGGETIPAARDGILLRGLALGEAAKKLPAIGLPEPPAGERLGGEALEQVGVLGAVPRPLRPLIEDVGFEDGLGVVVTMKGGIPIRFDSRGDAAAKWDAAAAVLADPELEALTYVDVRVPARPAVGGAA